MKSKFVFCLIFFVSCCCATPVLAASYSRRSEHVPAEKVLEFSLRNLKDSLKEIRQQNHGLISENTILREDVQYFQRLLQRLIVQKAVLEGGKQPTIGEQGKYSHLMEPVDLNDRERRTQDLIDIFQRDLGIIRGEIRRLETEMAPQKLESEKDQLLQRKQQRVKTVAKLEKSLRSMDGRLKKPQKVVDALHEEKRRLEATIAKMESGFR